MIRQAPKLLVAGAITGLTDTTHIISIWIARLLPESWISTPLENIAAWALAVSSIFLLLRLLKPVGKMFRVLGDAILRMHEALEAAGAWVAQRTERLVRRVLIRLSMAIRHVGLKLAR